MDLWSFGPKSSVHVWRPTGTGPKIPGPVIGGDIVAPEYALGRIRIEEPEIVGGKAEKKARRQANKESILWLIKYESFRQSTLKWLSILKIEKGQ